MKIWTPFGVLRAHFQKSRLLKHVYVVGSRWGIIYIYNAPWLWREIFSWIWTVDKKHLIWTKYRHFWTNVSGFPLAFIHFCPNFSYFGKSKLWFCVICTICVPFGCIPKINEIFFYQSCLWHQVFLSQENYWPSSLFKATTDFVWKLIIFLQNVQFWAQNPK